MHRAARQPAAEPRIGARPARGHDPRRRMIRIAITAEDRASRGLLDGGNALRQLLNDLAACVHAAPLIGYC